ncbi:hypothetical protein [Anaerococcus degeneri]|uniref:SH3b domain-containing protein n=1 Tax=Anaerococcus degeneri TaxID=361500 RepID=A0ABS7YXG5_9FIRM|nr:hypothetical protein [Anaerococcus degeneri]MBP2016114.1 hypothetical protein [Anaerococcus degeneri]MCA2096441.1 hypothetical protein [Anaerococcus degeneri]
MGWFTINKFIVFCLLIILAGCGKEEKYTKQDIETRPGTGMKLKDEIGIGLSYKVIKDAKIYTNPDEKTAFDSLEKGSVVVGSQEEENGFVYVTYQGQSFYIRVDCLEGI